MHVNAGGPGRPEALNLLELDMDVDVGTKLRSSAKAVCALNRWTLSLTLCFTFVLHYILFCVYVCMWGRQGEHACLGTCVAGVNSRRPSWESWELSSSHDAGQASSFPHWVVLLALHLILFNGFLFILSIFSSFMPHSFFFLPISGRKTNKPDNRKKQSILFQGEFISNIILLNIFIFWKIKMSQILKGGNKQRGKLHLVINHWDV